MDVGATDAPAGTARSGDGPGDPESVARTILLRQLTAAPKTRAQLEDALGRRGIPVDVISRVLDRFTELNLVDDEAFAQAWVDSRHAGRGLGPRALRAELARRGVADSTVSDAVARIGPEQQAETARRLVRARLPSTEGLDRQRRWRRLVGLLVRRGYNYGVAADAVADVLNEDPPEAFD